MCEMLKVTRSNYYHWLNTDTSEKDLQTEVDTKLVKNAFKLLKRNVGSRSIKGYLDNEKSIVMSLRKIRRIMVEQGLEAQTQKKFKNCNISHIKDPRIQPNKLDRNFIVSYPNQAWVADITYIKTSMGWMYLAAYIDLYSRKVVGWAIDTHMRSELIETALKRALWNRKPPKGLMVHTDQGSQFISNSYRRLLKHWSIKQSMSRRGNCWDNAVIESFFKTLKTETIYQHLKLISVKEMKQVIAEYMGHYNHIRPHSTNGYLSPVKFEQKRMEHLAQMEKSLGIRKC
jgi:transposase InsO family protein